MNNDRRKEIDRIKERISSLIADLSDIKDSIEVVRDEENEYLENMPGNMIDGERGEKAQAAIDALEEALSAVEDAGSTLDDATENLETAKE